MKQYLETLKYVYEKGVDHKDRTGKGRRSVFGITMRFDLRDGFPLVNTRKVSIKTILKELLWFITGSSSNQTLNENGVHIWDNWAVTQKDIDDFFVKYEKGLKNFTEEGTTAGLKSMLEANFLNSIGSMYGSAWRFVALEETLANSLFPKVREEDIASDKLSAYNELISSSLNSLSSEEKEAMEQNPELFNELRQNTLNQLHYQHIDQLQRLIIGLRDDPHSSRHVIVNWVPQFIPFEGLSPQENVLLGKGALPACHAMVQCYVQKNGNNRPLLSMKMDQRSADLPIGSVFNIAQYCLLLELLAHILGYEAHEFIYTIGDAHIYLDQLELVKEQLNREPLKLPKLVINPSVVDMYKITVDDIQLLNYEHHPAINYPIAV